MRHSTATISVRRVFVDTWGWLSFEDRKDPHHKAVSDLRNEAFAAGGIWVTTDYVLSETITRLFARRPFREAQEFCVGLFQARDTGVIRVEAIDAPRFARAWQLCLRYRDKPRISFTDLTSMQVMQELRIHQVITGNTHFRQAGFEILP